MRRILNPIWANSWARAYPIPLVAPVTAAHGIFPSSEYNLRRSFLFLKM